MPSGAIINSTLILFVIVSMSLLCYKFPIPITGMVLGGILVSFGFWVTRHSDILGNYIMIMWLGITGNMIGKMIRILKEDHKQRIRKF